MHRGFSAFAALVSATSLAVATPALADASDNARSAISQAKSVIATATSLGVGAELPALFQEATTALQSAERDLALGNQDKSLENARLAGQLVAMAIDVTQPSRDLAVKAQAEEADIAEQARIIAQREHETDVRAQAGELLMASYTVSQ